MNWIRQNRRSLPLVALLSVVCLILAFGETPWREALRYDREVLAANEQWWRWLTAHVVHASWSHVLMNVAGLWVVWLLFKHRFDGLAGVFIVVVSILTMDLGFWFRDTQLGWYVGLSGLLHGLYVAGALDEVQKGIKGGRWLLAGVIAKLAYEQVYGALPMTEQSSGGPVWVNSHLYGAVGGLIAAALLAAHASLKSTSGEAPLVSGDNKE